MEVDCSLHEVTVNWQFFKKTPNIPKPKKWYIFKPLDICEESTDSFGGPYLIHVEMKK